MSFGDDTLAPPELTCQGTKFLVARWMYDASIESLKFDGCGDLDDETVVKASEVHVLKGWHEVPRLAELIQEQAKEWYEPAEDEPPLFPIVWSWHYEPNKEQPARMILFRGEEEILSVWFEQVEPIS